MGAWEVGPVPLLLRYRVDEGWQVDPVRAEVADVEEVVLPLLGRVLQRHLGAPPARSRRDDGDPAGGHLPGPRALLLQEEEAHPEVDCGLDPQVPLAQGNKPRELQNGVRAHMMRLEPEELKERAKEIARGKAELRLKCV